MDNARFIPKLSSSYAEDRSFCADFASNFSHSISAWYDASDGDISVKHDANGSMSLSSMMSLVVIPLASMMSLVEMPLSRSAGDATDLCVQHRCCTLWNRVIMLVTAFCGDIHAEYDIINH